MLRTAPSDGTVDLIVMPESTTARSLGIPSGPTLEGPIRVERDRPGSIGRLDLADGALPRRAGHRGPLDGGYGAVNIALRHPSLFSVVESWSGYFTQTPTGPFAGATAAALRANSPAAYLHTLWSQLTADPIHVLRYISRTEPLRSSRCLRGSPQLAGRPGRSAHVRRAHNFALWSNHMALALGFAPAGSLAEGAEVSALLIGLGFALCARSPGRGIPLPAPERR